MSTHHTNAKERGAAHLVLVLAFVVGLVGVLGFLGYNAWQKQNADASSNGSLGRVAATLTCTNISTSLQPKIGERSVYSMTVKATNADANVRLAVWPESGQGVDAAKPKYGATRTITKDTSVTMKIPYTPPNKFTAVDGKKYEPKYVTVGLIKAGKTTYQGWICGKAFKV